MMIIIFKQSKLNGRNNMAWVAVDKSTVECIFGNKPKRKVGHWEDIDYIVHFVYGKEVACEIDTGLVLPKGSIKKLIGRDLTWEDEPVELKEE